jgi:hypothetical protein
VGRKIEEIHEKVGFSLKNRVYGLEKSLIFITIASSQGSGLPPNLKVNPTIPPVPHHRKRDFFCGYGTTHKFEIEFGGMRREGFACGIRIVCRRFG